ncbi:MAG: hypothetical protein AB7L17_12630 [Ilumatobacteraceae bacterium]
MHIAAEMVEQHFDTWPYAEDLTTIIVALGGFIVVGLWWMARHAARRPENPPDV